jgi:hypothetical protein
MVLKHLSRKEREEPIAEQWEREGLTVQDSPESA